MESTIVRWGSIGIMKNKMETTIRGLYRVEGLRHSRTLCHKLETS